MINRKISPLYCFRANNARAAANQVTSQTFGYHLSRMNLRSFLVKGMNLAYSGSFHYIGSHDQIMPNSVFLKLNQRLGGYSKPTFKVNIYICIHKKKKKKKKKKKNIFQNCSYI